MVRLLGVPVAMAMLIQWRQGELCFVFFAVFTLRFGRSKKRPQPNHPQPNHTVDGRDPAPVEVGS